MNFFNTKFLSKILVLAFAIILSSCQKEIKNNQNAKPLEKIETTSEIHFIGQWMHEGKRGDLVRDFCRNYEFHNQHLIVDLKFPEETLDDFQDRTSNIRFVANELYKSTPDWDIIRINNQLSAIGTECGDTNWAKNNLVDFSEIPEFRENTLPKLLTQEVKDQWGGIIPGPFLEGSFWAVYTNKKVNEKLGISVKERGMTTDDFIGYIKAVNNYNQNNPNDYIIPIHESGNWITSFAFAFQMFASSLNNTELLFNTQVSEAKLVAWEKTLIVLEQLANQNALGENYKQRLWEDSNGDLLKEQCLFYINGSWMYNIWESIDSERVKDIIPAELPTFNKIDLYPSAYFPVWGVLKSSPNKEEAVKFLLTMNQTEMADKWVEYTKSPTGIKGRMSDANFGTDQFEIFAAHIQNSYTENIYNFSEELAVYVNGIANAADTYFMEVLNGSMTANEAMTKIREKV